MHRFDDLFELSLDGILLREMSTDASQSRCLRANPAFCALSGRSEAEILALPPGNILIREDGATPAADWARLAEYEVLQRQKILLAKDGRRIPVEINTQRVKSQGQGMLLLSIVRDMAAHKQMEARLSQKSQGLALLAEAAKTLLGSDTPKQIIQAICEKAMPHFGCQIFLNYRVDGDGRRLRLNTCAGLPEAQSGPMEWLDFGASVCGLVAEAGHPVIACGLSGATDARTALIRSFGIRAYACHPLSFQGRILGTLSFGSVERDCFGEDELQLMQSVSDLVATALARQQAEEDLRGQRERLDGIIHSAMDAVISVDAEQRIRLFNPAAEKMFGHRAAQMLGAPLQRLLPERFRHSHAEHMRRFAQAGTTSRHMGALSEIYALRADGSELPVEASISQAEIAGQTFMTAILRDVGARKRAEAVLREAEEFKRAVLDAVSSHMAVLDGDGRIVAVNEPWRRFAVENDRNPDHDIGANYLDICRIAAGDSDAQAVQAGVQSVLAGTAEIFSHDYPCHSPTQQRWFTMNATPLKTKHGGAVIAHTDITGRKRIEGALCESEARMRMALEASHTFAFEWEPGSDRVLRTDASAAILGVPAAQARSDSGQNYFQRIHPNDRPRFLAVLADLGPQADSYHIEYRLIRGDGAEATLVESARGFFDTAGRLSRLVGTVTDIVEQRRAIDALRKAQTEQAAFRYARNLIEASLDPLVTICAEGKITDVNRATEQVTGRGRAELVGTNFADYFTEPDKAHESYKKVFSEGAVINYPLAIRHRDGRITEVLYNASLYRDEGGNVAGVFAAARDVTEHNRLAREKEQYFRFFTLSIDPMCIADPFGCFRQVNPAWMRLTGYSEAELLARPFLEFVVPEDRQRTRDEMRQLVASRPSLNFENRYLCKNGTVVYLSWTAYFDENDGVTYATAHDITERQRFLEELRKLSMAVEQSPVSIVITDLAANIEYVNAAFERCSGYSREEVQGKNPRFLKSGKTPVATFENLWQTLTQGQTWKGELVNRRKNGEEYIEYAIITPIRRADGEISHYIDVKEDITERKRIGQELDRHRQHLEELVSERTLELADARRKAEQANRAKSLFLANMSHEIRTPMNAVMGMVELCLQTNLSERQRNYLVKINAASNALLRIIDDILDFSKIEAGKLDIAQEPFAVGQVLDNLGALLADRARDKGLSLVIQMDAALAQAAFLGDSHRISQVLINLVGNAIKFSSRGEVRVTAEQQVQAAGQTVLCFAVSDEGIGLSPEQQARLFQPFSQADASTTRNFGGTGLGLALCRRLVEMMGGRIGVDSRLGIGSTFHFTVRCAATRQAPPQDAGRPGGDGAALARLRGADILLAEDVELSQEVICELLRQAGMSVRLAVNGEEVLQAVAEALPDCILMDCQMPVMDGYEATRRLRAQERCRGLPIIALTANAMASDREECRAVGMDAFLTKPVDFAQLCAALLQWVRPKPPAAPSADAASAPPRPSRLPTLPGIDSLAGLAQVRGSEDFYLRMLKLFRDSRASGFVEQFPAALAAGDWVAASRLAHNLKGVARTLGAKPLGDWAERLEEAIRQREPALIAERLAPLDAELARVLAMLGQLGGGA
ncbi:MAG: PAS domain S-box protein [Candidatus Methylumidiphilus sp.]